MSIADAWKANGRIFTIREAIIVLSDVSGTSRRPRAKRERSEALKTIATALRDQTVQDGLSYHTRRELVLHVRSPVRNTQGDIDPEKMICPLSWPELLAELLDSVAHLAEEAVQSRSRSFPLVVDAMQCFRLALNLCHQHTPVNSMRAVFLGFLKHAATWLSHAKLSCLAEDSWQCAHSILEIDPIRAVLPSSYFKFWADACFQQIIGTGPLFVNNPAITALSRRIFGVLSTEPKLRTCTLLQKDIQRLSAVRHSGDLRSDRTVSSVAELSGFYLILQRSCLCLSVAPTLSRSARREVESCALGAIGNVLSCHALDVVSSSTASCLIELGLPAALSCWSDRRHRSNALLFARTAMCLFNQVRVESPNIELLKERVLNDLCSTNVAVTCLNVGLQEIEQDLIELAASLFPFALVQERIEACSLPRAQPQALTSWTKVLLAILQRRTVESVLSVENTARVVLMLFEHSEASGVDLPEDCLKTLCAVVAETASIYFSMFDHHNKSLRRSNHCKTWVGQEMASDANERQQVAPFVANRASWSEIFCALWRQLGIGNATRRRTEILGMSPGRRKVRLGDAEVSVLGTLSFLLKTGLVVDHGQGLSSLMEILKIAVRYDENSATEACLSGAWTAQLEVALHFVQTALSCAKLPDENLSSNWQQLISILCSFCHPSGFSRPLDPQAAQRAARLATLAGSVAAAILSDVNAGPLHHIPESTGMSSCSGIELLELLRAFYTIPLTIHVTKAVDVVRKAQLVSLRTKLKLFPVRGFADVPNYTKLSELHRRYFALSDKARKTTPQVDGDVEAHLQGIMCDFWDSLLRFDKSEGGTTGNRDREPSGSVSGDVIGSENSQLETMSHNRNAPRHTSKNDLEVDNLFSDALMTDSAAEADRAASVREEVRVSSGCRSNESVLKSARNRVRIESQEALTAALLLVSFVGNRLLAGYAQDRTGSFIRLLNFSNSGENRVKSNALTLLSDTMKSVASSTSEMLLSEVCLSALPTALSRVGEILNCAENTGCLSCDFAGATGQVCSMCGLSASFQSVVVVLAQKFGEILNGWIRSQNEALMDLALGKHFCSDRAPDVGQAPEDVSGSRRTDISSGRGFQDLNQVGHVNFSTCITDDRNFVLSPDLHGPARKKRAVDKDRSKSYDGKRAPSDECASGKALSSSSWNSARVEKTIDQILDIFSAGVITYSAAREVVATKVANHLASISTAELEVGPDFKYRDMLACEALGFSHMRIRARIWDVLFSLNTENSADDAAEDILRVFEKWKSLCEMSSGLTDSYANEFGYKKRAAQPLHDNLEEIRNCVLLYGSKYLDICVMNRNRSHKSELSQECPAKRIKLIQEVVGMYDELCDAVKVVHTKEGTLPRCTRMAALQFSLMATAACALLVSVGTSEDASHSGDPGKSFRAMTICFRSFFNDSDSVVRLAASGCVSSFLELHRLLNPRKPTLDELLQCLPSVKMCTDPFISCILTCPEKQITEVLMDVSSSAPTLAYLPKAAQQLAQQLDVTLRHSPARFRGLCASIVLAEIVAVDAVCRGTALFELLSRTCACSGDESFVLGLLVRSSSLGGYEDPENLFRAHCRGVLRNWIGHTGRNLSLYAFPVHLLLCGHCDRENALVDWISEYVDEILPAIAAHDDPKSLDGVHKLADYLAIDVADLVEKHVTSLYRLYGTLFLHSTDMSACGAWSCLGRLSKRAVLSPEAIDSNIDDIIYALVMSVSAGSVPGFLCRKKTKSFQHRSFAGDFSCIQVPEYDPLSCGLLLNHLVGGPCTQPLLLRQEHWNCSLFDDSMGGLYDQISQLFSRRPFVLARLLTQIWQGLQGPPSPSSSESRCNSFMSLGLVYRLSRRTLVSNRFLRISLFDAITSGFQYPETVMNAKWLLEDVVERIFVLASSQDVCADFSIADGFESNRSCLTPDLSCLLQPTSTLDSAWWEILEMFVPELLSIAESTADDLVSEQARRASLQLVVGAKEHGSWIAVALLDPFPESKVYKKLRKLQEGCFEAFRRERKVSPESLLRYRLWRIAKRPEYFSNHPVSLLSRVRALRTLLRYEFDKNKSKLRSVFRCKGKQDDKSCHLATCALEALVTNVAKVSNASVTLMFDQGRPAVKRSYPSTLFCGVVDLSQLLDDFVDEAVVCIGVLGDSIALGCSVDRVMSASKAVDWDDEILYVLDVVSRELRLGNPVSRSMTLSALPRLLSMSKANAASDGDARLKDFFSVFAQPMQASGRKILSSAQLIDPDRGNVVRSPLPAVHEPSLWVDLPPDLCLADWEVPSEWIRTLASSLIVCCDAKSPLRVMNEICFASVSVSMELLPLLLRSCVLSNVGNLEVIEMLSNRVDLVLSRRDFPRACLRLFIRGLDLLCDAGLQQFSRADRNRQSSSHIARRQLTSRGTLYVLQIPYLRVAQAANRCGAYFSALRFAMLHAGVSLQSVRTDADSASDRLPASSSASSSASNAAHFDARKEVSGIIWNALQHIKETDGLRASLYRNRLLEGAAGLATNDADWCRMLGTYDALQSSSCIRHTHDQEIDTECIARLSLIHEREILRSMLGVGFYRGVGLYWDGLRSRLSQNIQNVDERTCAVFDDVEVEAVRDMHELRYEAAWKLGLWQKPAYLLSHVSAPFTWNESKYWQEGLHETVFDCLTLLRNINPEEVLSRVKRIRSILGNQVGSGFNECSVAVVVESVEAFRMIELIEDTASSMLGRSRYSTKVDPMCSRCSSDALSHGEFGHMLQNVCDRCSKRSVLGKRFHDGDISARSSLDGRSCEHKCFRRDAGVELHFSDSYKALLHRWKKEDQESLFCDRSAKDSACSVNTETRLFLKFALARSLGARNCLARTSADVVYAMTSARDVKTSWSGAANVLGTRSSVALEHCSSVDRGAWRLAEARLLWLMGEQGISKQQALRNLKNVISQDLGGSIKVQPTADNSAFQNFKLAWANVEAGSDAVEVARLRANACCVAANWSASLSEQDPPSLFNGYLKMGLAAFDGVPDTEGRCDAHFIMAEFADRQLKSIESYWKTEEYKFIENAMQRSIQTVDTLEAKLMGKDMSSKQLHGINRFIREAKKDIDRDRDRIAQMRDRYHRWLVLAAEHYAHALQTGCRHDLRAAFRVFTLWMNSSGKADLSMFFAGSLTRRDEFSGLTQIPSNKLLPLAPQLASRLSGNHSGNFIAALSALLVRMTVAHPGHCLWILIALSNSLAPPPPSAKQGALYRADKNKKEFADAILKKVYGHISGIVKHTSLLAKFYMSVCRVRKTSGKNVDGLSLRSSLFPKINDLSEIAIPTVTHPLHGFDSDSAPPYPVRFDDRAAVLGGKSSPLKVACLGSDGLFYPQVIKFEDDLRQDAVMQQLFCIVNELLVDWTESSKRNLGVRTYRVVPLSPFVGVMQFVENSEPFRDYLVGDETSEDTAAHGRYRPQDMKHSVILSKAASLTTKPIAARSNFVRKIWPFFQPVFRFFFLEKYRDPAIWFWRRLAYTRSTAVMSIVGWIIGLGDRHLSNILLDKKSAEVIHIDFGIAFEMGKRLPTPEHMPFRLTRDIVDGMGVDGVEGVFRRCCELTLEHMRENKDLLLVVIEVFLHDPLYNWSLSPSKALMNQDAKDKNDDCEGFSVGLALAGAANEGECTAGERNHHRPDETNDKAQHALTRISEKLDGTENTERLSVEAHVAHLIDQARSLDVLSTVYCGWAPWV